MKAINRSFLMRRLASMAGAGVLFLASPTMAGAPAPAAGTGDGAASAGLSAARQYNRGNALLREGKTGEAILHYERALLLSPMDADITANLRLARTRAGLWNGEDPALERLAGRFSFNDWGAIAGAALFLAAASFPLMLLAPRARPLWMGWRVVGLPAVLIALGALAVRWPDLDAAVITAKDAPARVAPAPAAGTVLNLREGEVVRIRQEHGEFLLIRNRENREGWVRKDALTPVVPRRG